MNVVKKMNFAAVVLLLSAGMVSAAEKKPNFLFVMVDDMAPDAIFHDRFDFMETPSFQRLAFAHTMTPDFVAVDISNETIVITDRQT